jgi:hypothetical protein
VPRQVGTAQRRGHQGIRQSNTNAIIDSVLAVSVQLARLCRKGILWVRMMWMMSVCIISDSTNQTVGKIDARQGSQPAPQAICFYHALPLAVWQTYLCRQWVLRPRRMREAKGRNCGQHERCLTQGIAQFLHSVVD